MAPTGEESTLCDVNTMVEALQTADAKKRVTKIPTFTGDKTDTLSPWEFVDRVELAAKAAKWDDKEKAFHFTLALEGTAAKWFKVTSDDKEDSWAEDFDQITADFIAWFEPSATGTRTLVGVRDMKQRQGEKMSHFAVRIKETVLLWRRFTPLPTFADSTEKKSLVRAGVRLGFDQMGLAMFCLGLANSQIQQKVLDASPKTLDEAVTTAVDLELANLSLQQSREGAAKVSMVDEREEEAEVDAIGGQGRRDNKKKSNNGSTNNGRPTFKCFYCKKPGHRQNRCFKRIQENGAMVDRQGKPLPSTNNNSNYVAAANVQPVQAGQGEQVSAVYQQSGSLNFLGVA